MFPEYGEPLTPGGALTRGHQGQKVTDLKPSTTSSNTVLNWNLDLLDKIYVNVIHSPGP